MKLSDYVVHFLADLGLKEVFVVTGGYAVNIIDSLHHEPRLKHVCVNHEQVAVMAAEGYSRFAGFGATITTNAPGAANLLNGIVGAWNDSVPVLCVCGQVPRYVWNRYLGDSPDREIVDIVTIVQSVTKAARYAEDPQRIRYYLEELVFIAKEGRPGPVLLDIPLDVQKADIDPGGLLGFNPEEGKNPSFFTESGILETQVQETATMMRNSKRPVVLFGGGLDSSRVAARKFIEILGVPTVATWRAWDILPYEHPLYFGTIGTYGNRRANLTIQNADLVISLGARLVPRQTGGDQSTFARAAKKIMVDAARSVFKQTQVRIDLPICANLSDFFGCFYSTNSGMNWLRIDEWQDTVADFRHNYPDVPGECHWQKGSVNAYVFAQVLSYMLPASVPVVPDCGGNLCWTVQAFRVQEGQRAFSNMGLSSMGYSLAATIGVCLANDQKPVACIIGDGGLQVHIQELETIKRLNLPIKIFVANNRRYGIIEQTERSWFGPFESNEALDKRCLATAVHNGYSSPDFVEVARGYKIKTIQINSHDEMAAGITETMNDLGPVVCEVLMDEYQQITPRLEFGNPLENQHPLLPEEELKKNMLIGTISETDETLVQGI